MGGIDFGNNTHLLRWALLGWTRQEVYVLKMKISYLLKTHFFSIKLTFIENFTLNSDHKKEI